MDSNVSEMRNDTVRSLVRALEQHGEGEGAHADRVAAYSTATAHQLGLLGEELVMLRWAASLHDVGKISVDPKLLKKLGKLSDEEMEQMRSHAEMAMRVISEFEWLNPVVPMVRHHHERYDGTGYPDGLAEEDIPLGARIIGVAETYDVLTQNFAWREPMSPDDALEEIQRCAGAQFDPKVVDAFALIQPLIQPVGLDA